MFQQIWDVFFGNTKQNPVGRSLLTKQMKHITEMYISLIQKFMGHPLIHIQPFGQFPAASLIGNRPGFV